MGKISSFQRRQLASTMTAVAPQDTSGQVIGKAVQSLGVQLTKRQNALDSAALSTAYYQYAAALNIGAMETRKQYQNDSNLDPTTFQEQFEQTVQNTIYNEFKEKLPARLQGRFEAQASKANASQSVSNAKWAFDQQNRNALMDFQSLNDQSAVFAGNAMNPDDYLAGRTGYLETSEQYRPLLTDKSFNATRESTLKQQAIMYWNNSVDFRNGGDPVALKRALTTNPELRNTLQKDIGPNQFRTLETRLDTAIKDMGADQAFQKLLVDNKDLSDKMKKLYDPNNDYGLKQVTSDLEKEMNRRNYMISANQDGQYDAAIEQTSENIENLQKLKRLAVYVNDTSYSSDPDAKSEIMAEIRLAMTPFKESKFKDRLAKVQKDIGNQLAKTDVKIPWHHYLFFPTAFRQGVLQFMEYRTGIPKEILHEQEGKERVKADQNISKYIQTVQTLKGKVLDRIEKKQLTYADGLKALQKIDMVGSVDQYDKLTTTGDNWFAQGFDSFTRYAQNLNLMAGTNVEANRQFRDDIRNQMMDEYTKRVSALGDLMPDEQARSGIINQIKYEKSMQINPEIMGAKPGDIINVSGQSVEFLGFSANTGRVQIKAKGLQKEVDNV